MDAPGAEDLSWGIAVHAELPPLTSLDEDEANSTLTVLLVASSLPTRNHFRELIARGGYHMVVAANGKEALRLLRLDTFALAVLHDVEDFTPSQLSREIKGYAHEEMQPEVPVILLASNFDPEYAVRCLRAGSDDYITGPHLEPRVLLARIEAVLRSYRRRTVERRREKKTVIRLSRLLIDPERFRVEVDGAPLDLTRIQFTLLYAMAANAGQTLTRAQLRGVIAEQGGYADDGSIKSHIYHLRRRMGAAGERIKTVRGSGYRISE